MADYKNSDRFIRTSKELDSKIHTQEHIRRWSWQMLKKLKKPNHCSKT